MLRSAAEDPVITHELNCCVALFSRCTEALRALKELTGEGFSRDALAGIGMVSPWLVAYLSQLNPPPEFPQSMIVKLQGNESMVVIGFPISSVSRALHEGNALNTTHILSLALSGMAILSTNQHEYVSALGHGQMLVIVRGSSAEVERAAELLATGAEIEVAVYEGACT